MRNRNEVGPAGREVGRDQEEQREGNHNQDITYKKKAMFNKTKNPKIWIQVLCINTLVTSKIY